MGNRRMSIGCSADKEAIYKEGIRATFIEIQLSNLEKELPSSLLHSGARGSEVE